MEKSKNLQKKYPEFIYQDYAYRINGSNLEIWLYFLIKPDLRFKTELVFENIPLKRFKRINKSGLENIIFHIGLIEMLNYWKLTCSPLINIKAGTLDKKQTAFLKKIILNGMGQYFYENKIDFTKKNFLKIESAKYIKKLEKSNTVLDERKTLVPVGGGKDSAIVLEQFLEKDFLGTFVLNSKQIQKNIIKISRSKEKIFAYREIDPLIKKLNKKGYLNGHVPFSAFLSFASILAALIFDYKNIAFAWEKSASQGNLKYKGEKINHQWSKSVYWEKSLQKYLHEYILENINIYSLIRNYSELEISQKFAKLEKYHKIFLSCNNAYKKENENPKWCNKCAKCLSVFIFLYPFISEEKLTQIFNANLLNKKNLIPLMKELIGEKNHKPFECVGTEKETKKALKLCIKKHGNKDLPILLKEFKKL